MRERDFIAPDLGNPFQHSTRPEPVEFDMTTDELAKARERERNSRHPRRPRHNDGPEAA